jgi:hypothetical protein
MSQAIEPAPLPPKVHKYQSLRSFPFVVKTMKFKQAAVMLDNFKNLDDKSFDQLSQRLVKVGVPPDEVQYYLLNRGACSVFTAKWLSEILGVPMLGGFSLGIRSTPMQRRHAVSQVVFRNAALQVERPAKPGVPKRTRDFLTLLTNVYGLRCVGLPITLSMHSFPDLASHSGSYFIACGSGGNVQHAAHAIGYSTLNDGGFFDPNAGEYAFTTGTSQSEKKEFLNEWKQINVRDGIEYSDFECYEVQRIL